MFYSDGYGLPARGISRLLCPPCNLSRSYRMSRSPIFGILTPERLRRLRDPFLLAAVYAFGGWLAHRLTHAEVFASLVWTPAGIALGALLARGCRLWPGVFLGALIIDLQTLPATLPPATALAAATAMALGATLQAWIGALLMRRLAGRGVPLDTGRAVWQFLAIGALGTCTVSATVGTATLLSIDLVARGAVLTTWGAWWVGDSLGVALLAPAVLALLMPDSALWRSRRLTAALPLLAALVIVSAAFLVVGRFERSNQQAEFDRNAGLLASTLESAFRNAEEAPSMLKDFRQATRSLDRESLEGLARRIHMRHSAMRALIWAPRVAAAERQAHEAVWEARSRSEFRIGERDAAGNCRPAAPRDTYFPVDWVVPLAGNAQLVGLDLAAEPALRQALDDAWRSGLPAASRRLLLEPGSEGWVVAFLVPVWEMDKDTVDPSLEGFAVSLIDVGRLAEAALQSLPRERLALRIEDLTAPPEARLLYESGSPDPRIAYRFSSRFEYGGASWQFTFASDSRHPYFQQAANAWPVFLGGLLFGSLLSAFLLMITGYSARAEELVLERTRDLVDAKVEAEKASKLLHEAVSSMTHGFTIYDENDRLVVCNEAYLQLYETSRDLIVPGATFEEIVRRGAERGQYPEAVGRIDEWVAKRVAQHQRADGQVIEQRLGDGRWLMIVEYRTPSGFIAGNRVDITEIKRSAAAVAERNAQLDAMFSLSPDGFVAFDAEDCVSFANPAFYRMTGISVEEIVGHDATPLEAAFRQRCEQPERFAGLASFFGAEGDAPRHSLLTFSKPRPATMQVVGIHSGAASMPRLLYLRDVTHETEVNRMKSEFLSHAAHELRTPMTSILGFTELLIRKNVPDDKRREMLETIHRQTRWLVDIVNELLDLARIEARRGKDFTIADVDFVALVRETLDAMSFDRQRWPVEADLPAGPVSIRGDYAKLRQACTNVLSNAQKYSPAGGAIHLEFRRDAGRVGLQVADHGIGMTPEQLAHFGERFWRADASGKTPGTGLGMAIVKEIIELHGGSLEVRSAAGVGTVITLWMPAGAAA